MKQKVRRQYPAEFKKEALRLAEKIGVSQASRRLEICENNLHRWKKEKKDQPIGKPQNVLKLQLEIRRLKRELAEEKAIVKMLKKTKTFFERESSNDRC